MHEFKVTLIQKIVAHRSDRNISYFISDGMLDFTVMAENEYQAERKMLDYFYENFWYNGDEDMPIEEFKNLTTVEKVNALFDMDCTFEYIVYYNPEKTKTKKVKIQ